HHRFDQGHELPARPADPGPGKSVSETGRPARSNDARSSRAPRPTARTLPMTLPRREFLRAAGVSLALPCLDVFAPGRAGAAGRQARQRMVCICTPLGLHPPYFFPEKEGKEYALTPYLEVLKDFRSDFTVVSGLSHAGMSPGFAHQASASFLTG